MGPAALEPDPRVRKTCIVASAKVAAKTALLSSALAQEIDFRSISTHQVKAANTVAALAALQMLP